MSFSKRQIYLLFSASFLVMVCAGLFYYMSSQRQEGDEQMQSNTGVQLEEVFPSKEEQLKNLEQMYQGGFDTQLMRNTYVSVETFEEKSGYQIFGKQCYEKGVRNSERAECTSIFFNASNTVHLYVPNNAAFPTRDRILAFPDADAETFEFLQTFTGFDTNAIHFAQHIRATEAINNKYVATSTPISEDEYSLLQAFKQDSTSGIQWLRETNYFVGDIQVSSFSDILRQQLRADFVQVSDDNGPLFNMYGSSVHPNNIYVYNNSLLYFDREGLFQIRPGSELVMLIDKDSKYMWMGVTMSII